MKRRFFEQWKAFLWKKNYSPSDVAELCRKNEREAYDRFWGNEGLISAYLDPARIELYMTIVKHVLAKNYGNRIVDIGFGSGDFLRLLTAHGGERKFEVYGLDYSEAAANRALTLIPYGNFITGDIYNLPYPTDYFDQIFCIQTLEHLKGPERVIMEMDRVCKPDGVILLSVPNGELDKYEGHVNFWSESEFKEFLSPRGLIDFKICNQGRAFMAVLNPLKK